MTIIDTPPKPLNQKLQSKLLKNKKKRLIPFAALSYEKKKELKDFYQVFTKEYMIISWGEFLKIKGYSINYGY